MNNSQPRSKVGQLDMEINGLTKVLLLCIMYMFILVLLYTLKFQVLFCAVMGLSLVMMALKGFNGPWYRYLFRFVLLFSYIIPIRLVYVFNDLIKLLSYDCILLSNLFCSLRVNLDMGKAFYSWSIQNDKEIQGTVVRSTTIPEELGRVSYLLSDKTGTLTQNEMVFKKLHLGTTSFNSETFDMVSSLHLNLFFI